MVKYHRPCHVQHRPAEYTYLCVQHVAVQALQDSKGQCVVENRTLTDVQHTLASNVAYPFIWWHESGPQGAEGGRPMLISPAARLSLINRASIHLTCSLQLQQMQGQRIEPWARMASVQWWRQDLRTGIQGLQQGLKYYRKASNYLG